jgi:hypothetical protein
VISKFPLDNDAQATELEEHIWSVFAVRVNRLRVGIYS